MRRVQYNIIFPFLRLRLGLGCFFLSRQKPLPACSSFPLSLSLSPLECRQKTYLKKKVDSLHLVGQFMGGPKKNWTFIAGQSEHKQAFNMLNIVSIRVNLFQSLWSVKISSKVSLSLSVWVGECECRCLCYDQAGQLPTWLCTWFLASGIEKKRSKTELVNATLTHTHTTKAKRFWAAFKVPPDIFSALNRSWLSPSTLRIFSPFRMCLQQVKMCQKEKNKKRGTFDFLLQDFRALTSTVCHHARKRFIFTTFLL